MNNFVIIYKFRNSESGDVFLSALKKTFGRHSMETVSGIQYILIAAKQISEVQDKITDIFDNLDIRDDDYVAVYYDRAEDPNDIKRLMMLGHSDWIDKDLKSAGTVYVRTLTELLDFDFTKQKANV